MTPVSACIGLGSNLGHRASALRRAVREIGRTCGRVTATSWLYETQPQLVEDQPAFLNAACTVETVLPPLELLSRLKAIERAAGRLARGPRYGPRPLDLDVCTYGSEQVAEPLLTVPHARLGERGFVLRPLLDMHPAMRHPVSHVPLRDMLHAVGDGGVQKVVAVPARCAKSGEVLRETIWPVDRP